LASEEEGCDAQDLERAAATTVEQDCRRLRPPQMPAADDTGSRKRSAPC
jgi:hypothetical protein